MPPSSVIGQPGPHCDWFATSPGQHLLDNELPSIHDAIAERPGLSWLWLTPVFQPVVALNTDGRGLRLRPSSAGWCGDLRCALPLPLANESLATVVVQHATRGGEAGKALLAECARVLVPGGRLWLYALNPVSPYRWHWKGQGLQASEPMPWRRRLRAAGLLPDPISQGLGPRWRTRIVVDGQASELQNSDLHHAELQHADLQHGPGLRAAWLLRAEKRTIPLTGLRQRPRLRIGEGVPAA